MNSPTDDPQPPRGALDDALPAMEPRRVSRPAAGRAPTPQGFVLFACLLGLSALSCTIFALDELPIPALALMAVGAAGVLLLPFEPGLVGLPNARIGRPSPGALALGVVVGLPPVIHLAATWQQNLPVYGDHVHHISHSFRSTLFWLSSPASELPERVDGAAAPAVLSRFALVAGLSLLVFPACATRTRRIAWCAAATGAALLLALQGTYPYWRYPPGAYLLDVPFDALVFLADASLTNGPRMANALALLGWLLIARPVLIRRWPEPVVVVPALVMVWPGEGLQFFSAAYLEPWGLVLALLAIELSVRESPRYAGSACLLIGAAACVKEPYVLALPFVWLAARPWAGLRRFVSVSVAALAAGTPFVHYYIMRGALDVGATRHAALGLEHLDGEFIGLFVARLLEPLGASGLPILALVPVVAAAGLVLAPARRWPTACMLGAGCAALGFILLETGSAAWPGYWRFSWYYLPFLLAGVFALACVDAPAARRWCQALSVAGFVLVSPSLFDGLARAFDGDHARAGSEYGSGPLFPPLRELTARAVDQGLLQAGDPITVNDLEGATSWMVGGIVPYVTRERFDWRFGAPGELQCRCTSAASVVMSVFQPVELLDRRARVQPGGACLRNVPRSVCDAWRAASDRAGSCRTEMQSTCARVLSAGSDGRVTGLLGAGAVP